MSTPRLTELDALDQDAFAARHIGPDPADVAAMLEVLGYDSLDALVDAAVPETIRDRSPMNLPAPLSEAAMLASLRKLASENRVLTSLLGLGYANTVTPGVILRNVLENPAWYTAYTPYQPEISQGRLEVLLNFQTMVTDLTGTDVANASLLDEPTAAAEAGSGPMWRAAKASWSSASRSVRRGVDMRGAPRFRPVPGVGAGARVCSPDQRPGPLPLCRGT